MDSVYEFKLKYFKPTADIIKRNYNGRKVVLFGNSPFLKELLKRDYGIKTALVATGIKEKIGKNGLIDIKALKNRSSEYYIAVPSLKSDISIKAELVALGYLEFRDFVFTMHNVVVIRPDSNDYHDEYGNYVHCKNCKVIIEPNVGNTYINVDDSCTFKENCLIDVRGSEANVQIAPNCRFERENTVLINAHGNLSIGSSTTFNNNNTISITHGNSVHIGNDCLLSYGIELFSGDAHSIFDVNSGIRTNSPKYEEIPKNTINIKDHVWIGLKSIILNNTVIERSSIVGAGAVVKGRFPNNCIIAGNPARIIKKNVTWNKNYLDSEIESCGEDNIRLTE